MTAPSTRRSFNRAMGFKLGVLFVWLAAVWVGCGAKSALEVDELLSADSEPARAAPDAGRAEVPMDEPDANLPVEDEPDPPPRHEPPPGCREGEATIHVLSGDEALYTFNPDTLEVKLLGELDCGEALNSMSIAHNGDVYVTSQTGSLYRVDADGPTCLPTAFDRGQLLGFKYAMGFAADDSPSGESLFIIEILPGGVSGRLSTIDLDTFELRPIARFAPGIPTAEITGTGDGRLFGFVAATASRSARLARIDPETAEVEDIADLRFVDSSPALDFAFWEGAFYFFYSAAGQPNSTVARLSLADETVQRLGTVAPRVIGAGVSTCAPLR